MHHEDCCPILWLDSVTETVFHTSKMRKNDTLWRHKDHDAWNHSDYEGEESEPNANCESNDDRPDVESRRQDVRKCGDHHHVCSQSMCTCRDLDGRRNALDLASGALDVCRPDFDPIWIWSAMRHAQAASTMKPRRIRCGRMKKASRRVSARSAETARLRESSAVLRLASLV